VLGGSGVEVGSGVGVAGSGIAVGSGPAVAVTSDVSGVMSASSESEPSPLEHATSAIIPTALNVVSHLPSFSSIRFFCCLFIPWTVSPFVMSANP
jgi:hypothetical protein